jgi:septum site-determining protein MinD
MGEVIVITSGKGGVGKTTATANIGTALAVNGKKVVLVDADIGLRNLDVVMGLENRIVYDVVDVVEGVCRLRQALIKDKRYPDLFLLPAAQTKDKNAVSPAQMQELCERLKQEFDFVLIDCPAGIEQGFKNAIAGADKAIVVTTPEISAVRDADRIIGLLEASELGSPKLLVNRVRIDMVKKGDMMNTVDCSMKLTSSITAMAHPLNLSSLLQREVPPRVLEQILPPVYQNQQRAQPLWFSEAGSHQCLYRLFCLHKGPWDKFRPYLM